MGGGGGLDNTCIYNRALTSAEANPHDDACSPAGAAAESGPVRGHVVGWGNNSQEA